MASVYSVSQVNTYIKNMFAQDFLLNRVSIQGEVSNCKYHTSGHIYFTLKDGSSTLAAVMFAGQRKGLGFLLQEGQQVVVKGSVDVYERDGKYQLYAQEIKLDGAGDLFERFQKLKEELEEMGMFANEYKQPIPRYAKKVGIVTALTGAAIQDVINISTRRNPYIQLVLYPALVQGEGAKESIAKGIGILDRLGMDVVIVGRGGGSIEDLWAFNEEVVARAIFDCKTPVISAVGHETDVTIADFVADMRAPTPSAAAELAVFDYQIFQGEVLYVQERLRKSMEDRLSYAKHRLERNQLRLQLFHPQRQIREQRQHLVDIEERLKELLKRHILDKKHHLALLSGKLSVLSPLMKISQGFGFLMDEQEHKIESIGQIKKGDSLQVRIKDGTIWTSVTKTKALPFQKEEQE